MVQLLFVVVRINRAHGHVDHGVAHPSVLPVQQLYLPIFQKKVIVHVGVDVGQAFLPAHAVQTVHQPVHPLPHLLIVLEENAAVAFAQFLVKCNALADIKIVPDPDATSMQLSQHFHALFQVSPVFGGGVARALVKVRDLISGLRVQIQQMLRDPQGRYRVVDLFLLDAVDQQLGSRPRDPADTLLALHLEQKGFVGHPRFQAADVPYLGLRHLKYPGHQL